jgi:ribulose 1,5-bisphosphate synthetase/thiazole synthase
MTREDTVHPAGLDVVVIDTGPVGLTGAWRLGPAGATCMVRSRRPFRDDVAG